MKTSIHKRLLLFYLLVAPAFLYMPGLRAQQTQIPNPDFESWINHGSYKDPQYWDTPNRYVATIPFLGKEVVVRSTSHYSGNYSAALVTQSILGVGVVPGFITLGTLNVNLSTGAYSVTGGVPVYDMPTHLMGFYKFLPQGVDSCVIGIGLWRRVNGNIDTVGYGYFSSLTPATDWTPFSAWINLDTTKVADSMNIIAISSAMDTGTSGTTLYVDDFYLDFTLGINKPNPEWDVKVYNDRETRRILLFFDFEEPGPVSWSVYDMTGKAILRSGIENIQQGKEEISYPEWRTGLYVVEVIHDHSRFCRKIIINP